MTNRLVTIAIALAVASVTAQALTPSPIDCVNPFIGTANYAACNPGAASPWGMMSVSPFNVMGSALNAYDKDSCWWSTPYAASNKYITGLSHVNLSGVGCPDAASLLLMATTGPLQVDYRQYGTTYSREKASPGYYSINLDSYGILAEATAIGHSGVTRFTFPAGQSHILLNLGQGLSNESGAYINAQCSMHNAQLPSGDNAPVNAQWQHGGKAGETIRSQLSTLHSKLYWEGMRVMGGFCNFPHVSWPLYWAMCISKKPEAWGYWKKQRGYQGPKATWVPDQGQYKIYDNFPGTMAGDDIGLWCTFDTQADETIEVAIGVSLVSAANARENLESELAGRDFDEVHALTRASWTDALGRIEIDGGTPEQREIFYTALYHALLQPVVANDINGQYRRMEGREVGIVSPGEEHYSIFSLWDTYRTLGPLLTLLYPERQEAMLQSLSRIAADSGWLPRWELFGQETGTMEGDPAIPYMVDAYRKGLHSWDVATAYKAMQRSATTPERDNILRPDHDPYIKRGFIPVGHYRHDDSGDNSVSHTLEYCTADAALSWLAQERGDSAMARDLERRSHYWSNYFSDESGTLRPRNDDGTFLEPFNPRQGENFEPVTGFHEGSAWNYTFAASHDIDTLARLMGGPSSLAANLQRVFDEGLYDPANEPDIAYPYIFTRLEGEGHRAGPLVDSLLKKYYGTGPGGLPGNDDTGTLSAWAVWSMMGLYPDVAATPEYALGRPAFPRITLHLNPSYHGRDNLIIQRHDSTSPSVASGGRELPWRISHDNLLHSGSLIFNIPAK